MIRTLTNQLVPLWHRLLASDPGLARLSLAARATATAALALGLLYALGKITDEPLPATLFGVVIALISSIAVNDPDPRQQRITTLLLPLPAALSITLGAWLAPFRIAGDAVFVAIIFGAVYVRRFGPRGFALGMLTFITYFFSLFLNTGFSQLPWLMLALVLGAACAYSMRFILFPERPKRRLQRILQAFYARVGRILDEATEAVSTQTKDQRRRRTLRRHIAQLNETALMAENALDRLARADSRSNQGINLPALELFDLELATERVAIASHDRLPEHVRENALQTLRGLKRALNRQNHGSIAGKLPAIEGAAQYRLTFALRDLATALTERPGGEAIEALLQRQQQRASDQEEPARNSSDESDKNTNEKNLRPTTRQAIQVAVAGALAIAAGEFVSPRRWYWAAITAFVIFAGTSSRGETLAKGWQRIAGTFAGVIAGIFIAVAIGANHALSLALIYACIFLAFYLFQISYGLMIFWITILLAQLYGLLGLFSVHLLTLRLEETALGAAIGVLVALFVLPASTRAAIRQASREFLDGLQTLVEQSTGRLASSKVTADPTIAARELDRRFQQLRRTANPVTRDLSGAFGRRSTRRWLRGLLACRYYARRLARLAEQVEPLTGDTALADAFVESAARIERNIRRLTNPAASIDSEASLETDHPFDPVGAALQKSDKRVQAAARCLRRIDRLILDLLHDFGAGRRTRRGEEKSCVSDRRARNA